MRFYALYGLLFQAVGELINCGELLKGEGWVDPSDPAAAAENELMGAANLIEAAAVKLSKLKPRQVHVSLIHFNFAFCFSLFGFTVYASPNFSIPILRPSATHSPIR